MAENPKTNRLDWLDIKVLKRNFSEFLQYIPKKINKFTASKKTLLKNLISSQYIAENNIKLGKHHFYQGNISDSIMRFKGAIFLKPENPEAFYYLGRCYLEKDDEPKAVRQFEACLNQDKTFTQAQYFLSKLQFPERVRRINTTFIVDTFTHFAKDYNLLMQGFGYNGHLVARSLLLNHCKEEGQKNIKNILDVGCIGGKTAMAMREKLALDEVVGIDICPEAVSALEREMYQDELLYTQLKIGDIEEVLPSYTDAFDVVLATRVLHYFGSLDHLLLSISQSLRMEGYFIGSVYIPSEKRWELNVKKDRFQHLVSYVKEEAKRYGLEWLESRKVSVIKDSNDDEMVMFICQKKPTKLPAVTKKQHTRTEIPQ